MSLSNSVLPLILASSSSYRRERLEQSGLTVTTHPAHIDEKPLNNETAQQLSTRLGRQKCDAVAHQYTEGLVIGSDQTAVVATEQGNVLLSKPGNCQSAIEQLKQCSGRTVHFFTSVCVKNAKTQRVSEKLDVTHVRFKSLTDQQIEQYLAIDEPFDCAGSFKVEQAGIFLFEYVRSDDPNALIGIPLILLSEAIDELGYSIFDFIGQ